MLALLIPLLLALPIGAGMTQATATDPVRTSYTLGPSDVVVVNVLGQTSLSGRYQIGGDGAFEFPLIGRVVASGKDLDALERELVERLAKGYLRKPQISVSIAEYGSQRVFIVGEVRVPGVIPITGQLTLLGAIAKAGGLADTAGGDLMLVRPVDGAQAAGPSLPNQPRVTIVLKASARDFRNGTLARNDMLLAGDTIFVPRAQTFQVLGQVHHPGSFTFETGMTVLRALSLAGGATELGAVNRLKILRTTGGSQGEVRARYQDQLEPGDTLFIPTRRW